VEGKTLTQ